MALAVAFLFAAGVFLVYQGLVLGGPGRREPGPGPRARLEARVAGLLAAAGRTDVAPASVLALALALGAGAALAAQVIFGWFAVSLVAGAGGAALPFLELARRAERLRERRAEAIAEAVDTLRGAMRGGAMGHEQAYRFLAHNAPEPLGPVLRDSLRYLELAGFREAVRWARDRVADPAFDQVAQALLVSHERGGNLGEVLAELSRHVRGQLAVRREVRALQARNVASARVVAALPVLLLVAIRALNPAYVEPYGTPLGQLVLAGCLVMVVVGYAVMHRMVRFRTEERLAWREEW